jgi:hypothetical protein
MARALQVALLIFLGTQAFAQEKPDLNLDDLMPPNAAALDILGVAPTEISRPTSAKAFALNILNDTVRSDGGLVSDFAMQFSPYWWRSHPDLTWSEFNGTYDEVSGRWRGGPDIPTTILQSLSFSMGITQIKVDETTDAASTDDVLGSFGISFDILRGRPSRAQLSLRSDIQHIATINSDRETQLELELEEKFGEDPAFKCDDPANASSPMCIEYEERLSAINSKFDAEMRAKNAEFRSKKRVGHRLKVAAAAAYRFKSGNTSNSEHARASAWVSYSYLGQRRDGGADALQWLAIARWSKNELEDFGNTDDQFDIGARLIWEPRDERLPLSLSFEYLRRMSDADEADGDSRFVGILQYDVNEEMSLFLSIGENFDSNLAPLLTAENLVAIIGFKLSGGSPISLKSYN